MELRNENCKWQSIRYGQICPICNSKKGRCSVLINEDTNEPVMYRCKYATSNRPSSNGWYLHLVSELNGSSPQYEKAKSIRLDERKVEPLTDEILELRDVVYRQFRAAIVNVTGEALRKEHKEDLLRRGLTEDLINKMGFFSIPKADDYVWYNNIKCKISTAIIREMEKSIKPQDIIRVAGFRKCTNKKTGSDYASFNTTVFDEQKQEFVFADGYYIPYHDYKGRLVCMQYRLTTDVLDEKGKPKRYLWFSSKVSSGSLIDYYIPSKITNDQCIILIEGALKGKISAEKLGIRTLAEAGVGSYRRLIHELQQIEKNEKKRYKVLLALDMDKYENNDVLSAETNTLALLKVLGHNVSIVEWDIKDGKGLDDKLMKSKEGFRFLNI